MRTKSMVESAWAEDMGQFFYHLDPDRRKITIKNNKQCSIVYKKKPALMYIYIYIYIYVCMYVNLKFL